MKRYQWHFHVHIHKTAGMTLRNQLQSNRDRLHIHEVYNRAFDYMEALKCQIIIGHYHYGAHFVMTQREDQFAYSSIVRDPLERQMSYYNYMQIDKEKSFEDYLLNDVPANLMCNQMFGLSYANWGHAQEILNSDYAFVGSQNNPQSLFEFTSQYFNCPNKVQPINVSGVKKPSISIRAHKQFIEKNEDDYKLYEFVGDFWLNKSKLNP